MLFAIAVATVPFAWAQSVSAAEPVTAAADSLRTSWYPDEPQLTPQLLEASGGFDRNFSTPVQGQVYAQPLSFDRTLFTATEDDWIYGIDAQSGEVKWDRSVGTPWNSADIGCGDLAPHVGITGTPVIDPNTNTAYFFAKSYVSTTQSGPAVWKMHAVDLSNGEERQGFPVTISGEAQNLPGLAFNPTQLLQRPALLLMNGVVYAGFGSHCDTPPFQGWLVGVSTAGQVKAMWATTEHNGAAIWQSGGGLISDREGQMLFATGNSWSPSPGPGSSPPEGHLGDSVVRVQVEPDGSLAAKDFFSPYNNLELDAEDLDLGSGAPLALPSPYFGTEAFPHLLVQVGKAGVVYLLNRDELGGMGQGPAGKNADIQESTIQNGVWGSLATWPGDGGYVYIPATAGKTPNNGALEFLEYGIDGTGRPELTPVARATGLEFGSGSPIVTSDGATPGSGIVWVSQCPESPNCEESTLDAYAAVPTGGTPDLLWSGEIGISTKFARPLASEGRIYVGTRDGNILGFGPTHHTLTVVREAESDGTVSSDVPGIECGSTCSHSYANGTEVVLSATPAAHFEFTGWSGGGCSGTGNCKVTIYAETGVTATFARIPHSLKVSKSGSGSGSVTSEPGGIECGSSCSAPFGEASTVTLTAVPTAHSTFAGWSGGGCSGTGQCHLTMYGDTEVSASFTPITHTITISKAGVGDGTVISRPAGIECGGGCNARFTEASNVTLEAIPGPSAVSWSGCTSATGRICEVDDLESDRVITASFLPLPETLMAGAKVDRKRRKATFRFRGTAETQGFQCRLAGPAGKGRRANRPFAPCVSAKTFRHLSPGRYTFQVRAVNPAGLDPTPASRHFRI